MNDEEREKLHETHRLTMDLHRALMEPSPSGDPPMIQRMGGVVVVVERSNWAARLLVRGFLLLGAIAGAWAAIRAVSGK